MLKRIKAFYNQYLAWINAYWLVTIAFLIVTLTVGDSSLYKRYTYDEKIRSLERFAREEYLMKRANEDIFIIEED